MQTNLDVRRHRDGSIDLAFYRRRAGRSRRLAKRIAFRRYRIRVGEIVLAAVAAIRKPLLHGGGYWWAARTASMPCAAAHGISFGRPNE